MEPADGRAGAGGGHADGEAGPPSPRGPRRDPRGHGAQRALIASSDAHEGLRVADALSTHGWSTRVLHAAHGDRILRELLDDPPDVVVPVGSGAPCGDGQLFAVARLAGVPCAGPTPQAGAIMRDRSLLARVIDALFAAEGWVRGPRGCTLDIHSEPGEIAAAVSALPPPLVVGPAYGVGGAGTQVCDTHEDAVKRVGDLLPGAGRAVVHRVERDVRAEISCVAIDTAAGPSLLPLVEHRPDRRVIPARLSAETAGRVEAAVLAIQRTTGAVGLTQTDLLITRSGDIVVLAQLGIPSLLEGSIAADAARAVGLSFVDLCVAYAGSAWLPRSEPVHGEPP